ncbi:uroporphyrinogen-III synthase [Pararhizobium haloflavum]|uniref:uroporphyrinogen-III synthase n=1 Tax=Pararhizobium haloflavum TaxID=2037914 RepID=UPI0013001688|nr:uroporphyrinogen-III synthase [Pararhizobium haloflavum]
MRVLVTRPEPGASQTAERLEALGHTAIAMPLSRTEPLMAGVNAAACPGSGDFVVTSAAAIRAVSDRASHDIVIWAVGKATADQARNAGFRNVMDGPGDGAGLSAMLVARRDQSNGPLTYLAGRVRSPVFERALMAAGVNFRTIDVYDTIDIDYGPDEIDALRSGRIDAVLLYSRRAAERFAEIAARHPAAGFDAAMIACLSENVAAGLPTAMRLKALWSRTPCEPALLELLSSNRNQGG